MILNLIWFPYQAVSNFWKLFCWVPCFRNFNERPTSIRQQNVLDQSDKAQSDVSYPPENCDLASAAGVQALKSQKNF